MDAVLPLTRADLDRAARILLPSLFHHYRDLGTLHIICPPQDCPVVAARLTDSRIKVHDEDRLVPEFAVGDRLGLPKVSGWFRQQLVKLASASLVNTPFFLTLDADVIALTEFRDADCFHGGRAIRHKHAKEDNPEWLDWSARVLGFPALDYQPGVTPAILSRQALLDLSDFIAHHVHPTAQRFRVARVLGKLSPRWHFDTWRGRLIVRLPWTEYSLYDTFLVHTHRYDALHVDPTDILLLGNCVWHQSDFAAWQPRSHDEAGRRIIFSVVQSRMIADPADVLARLPRTSAGPFAQS